MTPLQRSEPYYRQVRSPEITHEDRCSLVFDTDTKSLYVEREEAHLETDIGGTVEYETATMDIADYLPRRSNRWSPRTMAFAESALQ